MAEHTGGGGRAFLPLLGIALALGIGFVVVQVGRGAPTPISCTVGVNGAAVSATVRGVSARQICDRLTGQTIGSVKLVYMGQQESSDPVICTRSASGSVITVHDQGSFKVLGNAFCAALAQS